MLVDAGAEINSKGEHGFTPLMDAIAQGHVDAVKLFIELGAKPIRNNDGQLPSEYATISKNEEMAKMLRENGL